MLNDVILNTLKEKQRLKTDVQGEYVKIEAAIEYFLGLEEIFKKQKTLYLQKLAADFEVIRRLVDRKYVELKDKIEGIYDTNLRQAYRYIDGLSAIKESINTVQDAATDLKIDIDQLEINKVLSRQVKEI